MVIEDIAKHMPADGKVWIIIIPDIIIFLMVKQVNTYSSLYVREPFKLN